MPRRFASLCRMAFIKVCPPEGMRRSVASRFYGGIHIVQRKSFIITL